MPTLAVNRADITKINIRMVLPQKVNLRTGADVPPKSGCPTVVSKMSSSYRCNCPRTPTPLPLSRLMGITASKPTWKYPPTQITPGLTVPVVM